MGPLRRAGALSILAALPFPACAGTGPSPGSSGCELIVLGIAQDGGVPHVGCQRPCCRTARRRGLMLFPAAIGIHDPATGSLCLLEATPRIEPQLALLHSLTGVRPPGRPPVDAVALTHAHIGHYLGLAQFGREVAATDRLPVHVSPRFAAFLRGNGPWRQLIELEQIVLHEVAPGDSSEPIPGIRLETVAVPHRDEYSDTMAFRIHGPRHTVVFVPDVDSWEKTPGLLERLIAGADVVYLDATFYDGSELPGRDLRAIPHPLMTDTMARLAAPARERPGRFRFLHLNHTNPVLWDAALQQDIEARGFRIAQQGERVPL